LPAVRRRLLLLVATAAHVGGGCRVDVAMDVDVEEDGSGRVEVVVALDRDAARRVPGLDDQLVVDDLESAGWDVSGPSPVDGGGVEVRATKGFASLDGLADVVAEVSGRDGPLSDLVVERDRVAFGDTWRVRGEADLRDGLEAFGDAGLRERLGGTSFGMSEEELEEAAGRPLDEAVRFRVSADVPGGGGSWEPVLGERTALTADSRTWDWTRLALLVLAGVLALGAVVMVLARPRGGTRSGTPTRPRTPARPAG
jgi:hypothetical protein